MIEIVVILAGVIGLAAAGALGYRAAGQRKVGRALRIGSADGIAESGYVRIGGIDQWIQIRGQDLANPVLLFLHGSGMTMTPFTSVLAGWEKHFTVVQWDRRGVGKTRLRNGRADAGSLTFDLMAADGVEVAEHLRDRLGQDKIVLLGHSQGSIVGVMMAKRRPDLFRAYVGTGQITDMARNESQSYQAALERARAGGYVKEAGKLAALGEPPYPQARTWLRKQRWSFYTDPELQSWGKKAPRLLLTAPGLSLRELYQFNSAFTSYPEPLYAETMTWSASDLGLEFDVQFFLIQGENDEQTMTALAREYFEQVKAPAKRLVPLPGGGHCAVLVQPDAFLAGLLATVGPQPGVATVNR